MTAIHTQPGVLPARSEEGGVTARQPTVAVANSTTKSAPVARATPPTVMARYPRQGEMGPSVTGGVHVPAPPVAVWLAAAASRWKIRSSRAGFCDLTTSR